MDWTRCRRSSQDLSSPAVHGEPGRRDQFHGLIHIATLIPNDYYSFDPVHHRLVGERTATIFELGQELTVKVVKVNVWDRKVDFMLA